eukprot:TRINITY_DN3860_c0_g1_i3.p1 TRINITY_DN3860_c0_g1~~TRINITY_DN3860_c0_g1_i3.p1  ORF type:complete len:378 (-),score=75.61 TRINITY_DN3860_c0_g1_i3:439-1572(-)
MKAMKVQEVLHMNEGSGEASYAKNSQVQKKIISTAKPIIAEAIRDFCTSTNIKGSFGLADLGCSSGPNTLLLASDIIAIVEEMCHHLNRPFPEFQVYLNDLPGNDFNTLFRSLPAFYEKINKEEERDSSACFVAGVPGSFYGRLFPTRSLDFVHASSSLHWLSQVPPEIDAKSKTPLNEGRVYISKTSPPSVANAYLAQFKRDFSLFLKLRSEEIVARGRMVLTLSGRSNPDLTGGENCYKFDLLADALNDMVSEGLIEKEKVDSFNFPLYEPSPDELMLEIERQGSFFLHRQAVCKVDWDATATDNTTNEETGTTTRIQGEYVARAARAIVEPMLKEHFGEEVMENVFQRLVSLVQHVPRESAKYTVIINSLIRKG